MHQTRREHRIYGNITKLFPEYLTAIYRAFINAGEEMRHSRSNVSYVSSEEAETASKHRIIQGI